MKIKPATKNDLNQINQLVNSVYRGDNSKKGWTTEADMLGGQRIDQERIAEIINTPDNVILIASQNEKLIGCVHLEKRNTSCYLGMLSVDVNYQTAGIGKLLMLESENFACTQFNCSQMEMTVIGQRTELIEYYKRRGYHVTGEKKEFPTDDPRFGLPKRDDLYFEVLVKSLD